MSMSSGIHSSEWVTYESVAPSLEFGDKAVNYSARFINPASFIHTQNVESHRTKHKYTIKFMKGTSRSKLPPYLQE
jgi:hypothetical protein